MIGLLHALLLSLKTFGELAIVTTEARDLVLLLGEHVEQPPGWQYFGMNCERSILLGAALLGELLNIGAVVHNPTAVLLGADLFGVACRLSLADSEELGDVFHLDIDRCLVRFHDERV